MTAPVPGTVWVDCDPRSTVRVRVVTVDSRYANVVDADTGQRPRRILLTSFHDSPTTRTGQPRRRGYAPQEQQ